MNLRHTPTTTGEEAYPRNTTGRILRGRWFVLARILWIAVVVLILAFFVASILTFNTTLHQACTTAACYTLIAPYTVKQIQAAGFSLNFVLIYNYALTIFFLLAFLLIGIVIFWLKSNDRMALFTSFALVTFGVAFNNTWLIAFVPAWWLPFQIISFLGYVSFCTFFYLFPNGGFVPRWTRWLVVGWVLCWAVAFFFPNYPFGTSWFILVLLACLAVSLLVAQIYRYLWVSSQVERQQTKWVVFGTSIGLIGFFLVTLLFYNNVLTIFKPGPLFALIANTGVNVFLLLIPLSIAIAILRSRLWDIDIIINRTLVYGTLTVLLALVYVGLIFALQYLLRGIISQNNDVAIVVSTLTIAALFQPLRHRIQAIIDQRFYRRKYDATKTLEAFSATLRDEVDLSQLREHLLNVVQETMQPAHVSLWLRQPTHRATPSLQTSKAPTEEARVLEQSAGHDE